MHIKGKPMVLNQNDTSSAICVDPRHTLNVMRSFIYCGCRSTKLRLNTDANELSNAIYVIQRHSLEVTKKVTLYGCMGKFRIRTFNPCYECKNGTEHERYFKCNSCESKANTEPMPCWGHTKLFSQAVEVSRNLVKILNLNQSTNTHVICVHLLVLRWNILDHTKNYIW